MSREVCGICWCPYDEDTGECACPPPSVQKSTLRTAAQQALNAMQSFEGGTNGLYEGEFAQEIAALRAALAGPTVPSDCPDGHQPVAWMHVPHPGNGTSPMVSLGPQREPSMYAASVPLYVSPPRCSNCASLEEQNTELDRRLAELERKPLTDEKILNMIADGLQFGTFFDVARAIERAHGIGGQDD